MGNHVRRKAVPGRSSRSSSPAITPASQPLQHARTSRVGSYSAISRRSSDETDETERYPRDSVIRRVSSDEETAQADSFVPRKSPRDYTSLPGDPRSDAGPPSYRRPSGDTAKGARMQDKLGRWPATLIVLCLVLLAASSGFLSWIWFASREDSRWRNLVLGPSSAVAVTITTFVVRIAIAGLSWVTVAMMASVVVERHGVPEGKMAEASMARYTGSIISLALDGFTLKTSWFRILVPLQVICAVLSQLSSTLLFSDFQNDLLPGFPVDTDVRYDFTGSNNGTGPLSSSDALSAYAPEWNRFVPETFEPFAEHSVPEEKISDDAVDDTGPVWRALLPLGAYDNTTNINEYNGVARVFDARTICVRPEIQNFTLYGQNSTDGRELWWMGGARIDASAVPDVIDAGDDGLFEVEFKCPLTDDDAINPLRTKWVQCWGGVRNHRIPTLDPIFYNRSAIDALDAEWRQETDERNKDKIIDGPGTVAGTGVPGDYSPQGRIFASRTGQATMLMEARYELAEWHTRAVSDTVFVGTNDNLTMEVVSSKEEGPWSVLEMEVEGDDGRVLGDEPIERKPIPMRFSWCWDVMSHGNAPVPYLNITATSDTIVSPPVTSWSEATARYVTDGVRSQLGATASRLPPSQRAVLSLTKESLERAIETEVKPANISAFVKGINTESDDDLAYRTYLAKTVSEPFSYDVDSGTQVFWETLLKDVIEETGSPALAVQAVNTAASRMIYSHWMGSFTEGARADITYFTEFRVPVKVVGYSIVMAVIAVQVALLVVVGVMFRACTGSVLNDAWLVVSQVSSSPEGVGALVRERAVTDAEVRRFGGGKDGLRRRVVVRDDAFRGSDGV